MGIQQNKIGKIAMKTVSTSVILLLTGLLIGCNSSTPQAEQGKTTEPAHEAHGNHAGMTDMEMMKETLAKLPPEDAATAQKQHVCPVSGEMLGTMGLPVKVSVKERDVWVCCKNCVGKLKADPEKYLAKLNK